jgi:dinuclear metal center YbgI/SA1388 family protein
MLIRDAVGALENIAPLAHAEAWDNVGLLVGDPGRSLRHVLVCIDLTPVVWAEACESRAELIVCYHPPIFSGLKRIAHGSVVAEAIRHDVALYSPHTALDVARGGTNDVLADAAGLGPARRCLRPSKAGRSDSDPALGMGRIGDIDPTPRAEIVRRVKAALSLEHALVAGPLEGDARSVAVCAGAAGELLAVAAAEGADVLVTGEVRHHDALALAREGRTVIALLHSNSERAAMAPLAARLGEALAGVDVRTSREDRDPMRLA